MICVPHECEVADSNSSAFSFSRLREKVPEADEGELAMSNQLALTPTLSRGAGEGK